MSTTTTHLSNAPNGLGIKISSTNSAVQGELVHTHSLSCEGSLFDEVYLLAYNSHTSPVVLNIQWGGTTSPDNVLDISIAAGSFLSVVSGMLISGNSTVSATASVTNKIVIYGHSVCHMK